MSRPQPEQMRMLLTQVLQRLQTFLRRTLPPESLPELFLDMSSLDTRLRDWGVPPDLAPTFRALDRGIEDALALLSRLSPSSGPTAPRRGDDQWGRG